MKGQKGHQWPAEWRRFQDPLSGLPVCQLTNHKAHSRHLYFTDNGWYDGNQRLLFISDRGNCTNIYSLYLVDGTLTQLTDLGPEHTDLSVCLNPAGTMLYYRLRNQVIELNLATLQESLLYEGPAGFGVGQISCTADGRYLITGLSENLSHRFRVDLGNGYVGHREIMEAGPLSRIIRIPTDGGAAEVMLEENEWIGHVNTSPTQPHLLTFCHEGPWHLVDHRIWGLNLLTNERWKIRPRKEPQEKVGHEYWHADGLHLGFHGFREDGTGFFGTINFDNTELAEEEFHFRNWHAHSNDFNQIVVDGRSPSNVMVYWQNRNGSFTKPKLLCEHRCSFHSQMVHAHPRFSPDGRQLLFTSDRNAYGNLYLVELPEDADSLPDYEFPRT